MPRFVGIDLGTTNSVVTVMEAGEPLVIPNSEGARTTPSIVAFSKTNDEILAGQIAKNQAITNADRTIRSVKRHMGTSWKIGIDGKDYNAQQISAFILQKLKRDAESYLGDKVTEAVITVPAYFDDSQRQATKEAGEIAGLKVLRIINEPTAAALAYGLEREGKEEVVLVFDLGGGTFDVSILELGDGVFEVKATHGDTALGGDDWDQVVIDHIVAGFKAQNGIDLSNDKMAAQRLKEAAEKAKIELSQAQQATISLPFITANSEGPVHYETTLTRAEFERLTSHLVDRCKNPFNEAIKDAKIQMSDLTHVLLVGGSTRMPSIQKLVKDLTGKDAQKGVNPDEVVSMGAAIQASIIKGDTKEVLLLDVTPLSMGVETMGGVYHKLIEKNTHIPTRRSETFTTAADNQPSVEINVLQGEGGMSDSAGVRSLGKFQLVGLPPAARGVPQVEVTFDIDANGIVNVSAKDQATGKEQAMTITGGTALPREEIDRLVRDAEANAEKDNARRELAEARNHADTAVYQVEKALENLGDKVSDADRETVNGKIQAVKEALTGEDTAAITTATEALLKASQELASQAYQTTPDAEPSTNGADNVEDAEVVEGEVVEESS